VPKNANPYREIGMDESNAIHAHPLQMLELCTLRESELSPA
jgi:hypothetical protein